VPRVLLLTTPAEDYLQDQVLYGLRSLLGADCVDFPRKDVMYRACARPAAELYGRGFTLWKLLPEIEVERGNLDDPDAAARAGFELVLFGRVREQRELLRRWNAARLPRGLRVAFLDGGDTPKVLLPTALRGRYFKRERTARSAPFTRAVSFSIPAAKLVAEVPRDKPRRFATHVQCEEAYALEAVRRECQRAYAFADEDAYRADLQRSHFGITMRKGGWDCMRHYEIAANGCVPCFHRLAHKSRFGAPFELVDGQNCLAFDSAAELERKTREALEGGRYAALAANALDWARRYTCERVAAGILRSASPR